MCVSEKSKQFDAKVIFLFEKRSTGFPTFLSKVIIFDGPVESREKKADESIIIFNFAEISEMDANIEEISGRIAFGVPVSREPGYFSAATESEAPAQAVAMDLRPVRQVLLRREASGRPLR